jgi:peroxiredoxin
MSASTGATASTCRRCTPAPATYVVGSDGVVRYAFADPDWTRRAEPDELVAVVRDRLQASAAG